jgi:hypothetical protein
MTQLCPQGILSSLFPKRRSRPTADDDAAARGDNFRSCFPSTLENQQGWAATDSESDSRCCVWQIAITIVSFHVPASNTVVNTKTHLSALCSSCDYTRCMRSRATSTQKQVSLFWSIRDVERESCQVNCRSTRDLPFDTLDREMHVYRKCCVFAHL